MKRPPGAARNERGDILVMAIILVMLLLLICSLCLQVSFGRAVVVEKSLDSLEDEFLARQAYYVVSNCLYNPVPAQCNVAYLSSCDPDTHFPLTVPYKNRVKCVTLPSAAWVGSSCQFQVQVYDPATGSCG